MNDLVEQAKRADLRDYGLSAATLYRHLVRLHPEKSIYRVRLAENLRSLGRLTEAARVIKSVKRIPDEKRWFLELIRAQLYMDQRKVRFAERHFRKAALLNPRSTVPWVYLSTCLAAQEKFREAVSSLKRGLDAEGDRDEVFYNLGNAYRALGELNQSKEAYEKAIELSPDYSEAKHALDDLSFAEQHPK